MKGGKLWLRNCLNCSILEGLFAVYRWAVLRRLAGIGQQGFQMIWGIWLGSEMNPVVIGDEGNTRGGCSGSALPLSFVRKMMMMMMI